MTKSRFIAFLLAAAAVLLGAAESRAAIFGDTTYRTSVLSIEDNIVGCVFTVDSNGVAERIDAWLYFSDAGTWNVCFGIYAWNGGTNPSFVGKTAATECNAAGAGDGYIHGYFSDPKPYLVGGERYVLCAWSNDVASKSASLRITSVGQTPNDTVAYDPQTYSSTWPDPMGKTNLNGYRASIGCFYTPCTKMVLSDSASLCLGNIGPAVSAYTDTVLVSADGDTVAWAASSGADYTCVDEATPSTTDYVQNAALLNKTEMFNIADDTSYYGIDSCKILVYARYSPTSEGACNRIMYEIDTAYATPSQPFRIGSFDLTGSWTTYTSPNLPAMTKAQFLRLQIGFRDSLGACMSETEEHQVAWIALKRFRSAGPALDVWADSLLNVGSVSAYGKQRRNRVLLSIRDTDSIGYYTSQGWLDTLAYLKIMTKGFSPATTRYLVARQIVALNGDYASQPVKWATTNAASYAHSNWTYQSTSDTAWNKVGADSTEVDWCYPHGIDSVAIAQNTTITWDVTPWIRLLNWTADSIRHRAAGLLLFLSPEDSAANAYGSIGNVQPPAGADSTWLEIYRIPLGNLPFVEQTYATLGYNNTPSASVTLRQYMRIVRATAASSGTLNSFSWYAYSASGTTSIRCALYDSSSTISLVDSVAPATDSTTGWKTRDFIGGASITSGHRYALIPWGNTSGTIMALGRTTPTGYTIGNSTAYTWTNAWPGTITWTANSTGQGSVYCTYTVAEAGGTNARRRRIMGQIGGVEFDVSEDSLKYVVPKEWGAP